MSSAFEGSLVARIAVPAPGWSSPRAGVARRRCRTVDCSQQGLRLEWKCHVAMATPATDNLSRRLPHHVAVVGAAGGLGQGILSVCRAEGIGFTAIVRSRPGRITDVPGGSRVAVVSSLADRAALSEAFSGAAAVLAVLGETSRSHDRSALLSANMTTV